MKFNLYFNSQENFYYEIFEINFQNGSFRKTKIKCNETKIRVKSEIFAENQFNKINNLEEVNNIINDFNSLRKSKGFQGDFQLIENTSDVNRPYYVDFKKCA